MSVDTLVAAVGALPEPPIEVFLDSIEEMCASDIRAPLRFTVSVPWVGVDVDLRCFTIEGQIVRVFALLAFLADTRLMVGAQNRLRVFTLLQGLLLNCRH